MNLRCAFLIPAFVCVMSICLPSYTSAIPIDDFEVKQTLFGDPAGTVTQGIANPGSLGGSRSLVLTISAGNNLIT